MYWSGFLCLCYIFTCTCAVILVVCRYHRQQCSCKSDCGAWPFPRIPMLVIWSMAISLKYAVFNSPICSGDLITMVTKVLSCSAFGMLYSDMCLLVEATIIVYCAHWLVLESWDDVVSSLGACQFTATSLALLIQCIDANILYYYTCFSECLWLTVGRQETGKCMQQVWPLNREGTCSLVHCVGVLMYIMYVLSLLHSETYEEEQDRDIVRDNPDYRWLQLSVWKLIANL